MLYLGEPKLQANISLYDLMSMNASLNKTCNLI